MPLTQAGRDFIAQAIVNDSPTFFANANAHIGVGNGSAAFAAAQTDLQGVSKLRKPMQSGYPQRTGNVLTFRALFETGEANFQWQEWGLFNAAASGVMLNRQVGYLGEKTSAAAWQLTVTLTVDIGS